MLIYGKNLYKSSSPDPRMSFAESLHKSSGTGDLSELLKSDKLTFDLFMARSSLLPYAFYGHHTFVWEKC